jgi:aspartate/methionine/tyrosine aminotransferase
MKKIDLGLGSPTAVGPIPALDRRDAESRKEGGTGYAPLQGELEAREAVVRWKSRQFGVTGLDVENVSFGEGSRLLIVASLKAYFQPGDDIALMGRYYNGHMDAAKAFGLNPVVVPSATAAEYLSGIEDRCRAGNPPKGVFACFVSNPGGTSCEPDFYERLVPLALEHGMIILDDYAYGALDYTNGFVPSSLKPEGAINCVVWFGTASKMFSLADFKVGFAITNARRAEELLAVKKLFSEGGPRSNQLGVATALDHCGYYVDDIREVYRHRAVGTTQCVTEAGCVGAKVPDGGMFGLYPVPERYQNHGGATAFVRDLDERGVVVRSDEAYGGDNTHIRWCYRVSDTDTWAACDVIADLAKGRKPAVIFA